MIDTQTVRIKKLYLECPWCQHQNKLTPDEFLKLPTDVPRPSIVYREVVCEKCEKIFFSPTTGKDLQNDRILNALLG